MANTLKTLSGELLVSEVEAIVTENVASVSLGGRSGLKVVAVSKSGLKYDLSSGLSNVLAAKVATATATYVAGTGHTVFDPTDVK